MFDHNHYVPILKWKRGERTALKNLTQTTKNNLTPLIEVQPVPFDHTIGDFKKTIDEHLDGIGSQVKECYKKDSFIFVECYTLYDNEDFNDQELLQNGQHPVEFVIDSIESEGVSAIPVTGLYRNQAFQNAIKNVCQKYKRGVCIRLEERDLSNLTTLKTNLDQLISFLNVEKHDVDIVLDYKQIIPHQRQLHFKNVILTIAMLPYLSEWRNLILASTAFPKSLKQIPTGTNGTLDRTEWRIYQQLSQIGLARIPVFSDYNITHPDFINLDPRLINMAANIRYTADNEFLIFRGIGVKRNGYGQMTQLAQSLISHSQFRGPNFSYGDQYIYDCAHQKVSTGKAETWVTVGVNHHLTLVVHDLSNLSGSSIAQSQ